LQYNIILDLKICILIFLAFLFIDIEFYCNSIPVNITNIIKIKKTFEHLKYCISYIKIKKDLNNIQNLSLTNTNKNQTFLV